MIEVAINEIKRLRAWMIPSTGSKLEYYEITLASTSYTDLVHTAAAAITGKGELVAIGVRESTDAITNRLSAIQTTVDGGAATEITGLGAASGVANLSGMAGGDNEHVETRWIPCNLPFNSSLLVRAKTTAASGNIYVYAIVRKVV